MVRRKKMWIIFGIVASVLTIAAIIVPITIVLTRKANGIATATGITKKTTQITTIKPTTKKTTRKPTTKKTTQASIENITIGN